MAAPAAARALRVLWCGEPEFGAGFRAVRGALADAGRLGSPPMDERGCSEERVRGAVGLEEPRLLGRADGLFQAALLAPALAPSSRPPRA